MNQIPNKAEYCGDCPCLEKQTIWNSRKCNLYPKRYVTNFGEGFKRCSQCLSGKPQILMEKEREMIKSYAIHEWIGKGEKI
jgi:hypothetical protein